MADDALTHVPEAGAVQQGQNNPYVGPRTFERADHDRFYGRDREARELLALVISQRLALFYAQSGAGKSSLLNTRLAPQLEEQGFAVLPVARVSGELPPDAADKSNVFLYNLMQSIDRRTQPKQLADLALSDFLNGLTSDDGSVWRYEPVSRTGGHERAGDGDAWATPNTVLIIDQFEEIFTTHLDRWRQRADFFTALDATLAADPHLWVVLTLREDYVAPLDPYAPLMTDKLRARYYMERMSVAAALEAVKRPAQDSGRPFAPGVAEELVDNLRRVRVPGQADAQAGQYVEPVQLQVVCYQLWESLAGRPLGPIRREDLPLDYIDRALTQFYEDALAGALADPKVQAAGIDERRLRAWFSNRLITPAGTRGTLFYDEERGTTEGLPNAAVDILGKQFLLRSEPRAGGTWIELVHDRFIEPIVEANREVLTLHEDPLTRAARAWVEAGRARTMVFYGRKLNEAQATLLARPEDFGELEAEFVQAGQRRQNQTLGCGALVFLVVLVALGTLAFRASLNARRAQESERVALARKVEVEGAGTEVALANLTAQAGLDAARAALTVAADSLASQAALLESVLGTAPADALTPTPTTPTLTPSPTTTPTATLTPTVTPVGNASPSPATPTRAPTPLPSPTATATPPPTVLDPKLAAQATELANIRIRQTELANSPVQQAVIPTWQPRRCTIQPAAAFTGLSQQAGVPLGCATAQAITLDSACEQVFQGGILFWRSDTSQIYVVFDRDKATGQLSAAGGWFVGPAQWGWDGSNPDGVGMQPAPGLFEPVRGLGWLWRQYLGSHEGPLGWATTRTDQCFSQRIQTQQFARGIAYMSSDGRTYALLTTLGLGPVRRTGWPPIWQFLAE